VKPVWIIAGSFCLLCRTVAAECAFGWLPIDGHEELARTVLTNDIGIDAVDLAHAAGRIDVSPVDLDGDGIEELCIHAVTTVTCSNGVVVCSHVLWSVKEQKVLLSSATHRLGFAARDRKKYTDIRSEWSASDGHIYAQTFEFHGMVYAPNERVRIGSRFPSLNDQ
jgi:hypothetical protein